MISVTIIILSLLVLLFAFMYKEFCKDIQQIRDYIYRLEKKINRDAIEKLQEDVEKLQRDIEKLQKELEELDVRRYSGQTQLTEWVKAISNKLKTLSYD